jgi:hypothetical protein
MEQKIPDLTIPWSVAIQIVKIHVMAKLIREGYSPEKIQQMIEDSLKPEGPTEELRKIAQQVLNEAGLEYTRRPDRPGMGRPVNAIIDLDKP